MSQLIDNFSEKIIQRRSIFRLILDIWIKPGSTVQYIIQNVSLAWSLVFMFILGIPMFYDASWSVILSSFTKLPADVTFAGFLAGITGLLYFILLSFIFHLTCRLFKCNSTIQNSIAIFSWVRIPQIAGSIILFILANINFGSDNATDKLIYPGVSSSQLGNSIIHAVFAFWTLILFIIAIRKVYDVKTWKAIIIAILPGIIISIIAFLATFFLMPMRAGINFG